MGQVHAHPGDAFAAQVHQVGGAVCIQTLHHRHVGVAIVLAAVAVPIVGVVEEHRVPHPKLALLLRVDPVLSGQVIERRCISRAQIHPGPGVGGVHKAGAVVPIGGPPGVQSALPHQG